MEHILVAERVLGRPLVWHGQHDPRSEVVHHLNGDKSDNRPENLEVTTNAEHGRAHHEERAYGRRINTTTAPIAASPRGGRGRRRDTPLLPAVACVVLPGCAADADAILVAAAVLAPLWVLAAARRLRRRWA